MAEGGKRNMEYKKFSVRKFSERAEVVGIQEKCSKLIKGRKFYLIADYNELINGIEDLLYFERLSPSLWDRMI
mgnify:CR=1 FL=1